MEVESALRRALGRVPMKTKSLREETYVIALDQRDEVVRRFPGLGLDSNNVSTDGDRSGVAVEDSDDRSLDDDLDRF